MTKKEGSVPRTKIETTQTVVIEMEELVRLNPEFAKDKGVLESIFIEDEEYTHDVKVTLVWKKAKYI